MAVFLLLAECIFTASQQPVISHTPCRESSVDQGEERARSGGAGPSATSGHVEDCTPCQCSPELESSGAVSSADGTRLEDRARDNAAVGLDKVTSTSKNAGAMNSSVGTGDNTAIRNPHHDEWLVFQFQVDANLQPGVDYTLLTMTAHAVAAKSPVPKQNLCRTLAEDSSVLRVVVPHSHGKIRQVQLQSDCVERIRPSPLNETWPIEPSWSFSPLSLENPIRTRNGAGTVKVTVDSHVVATGQFKLNSHGHAAWSDLTALQK